jgi:predicted nucleic acid-binding protein
MRSTGSSQQLIVLDASAATEFVLGRALAVDIQRRLDRQTALVPVFFDAEVFAAVRGLIRRRVIDAQQGQQALFLLRRIRVRRVAVRPLIAEAFAVRDRFSPYDAFYAIVARLTEAILITTDRALARAGEGYCEVEYVALR